jgi:hypothetical protein
VVTSLIQEVTERVLGDLTVTSNAATYLFYTRTGRSGTTSSFETDVAIETGHAVRSEVRRPSVVARNE